MRESRFWLLQLLTGVVMIGLLGFHLVYLHLDTVLGWFGLASGDVLAYSSVMARADNGSWAAFYIIFLAFAVYHGFYGLRSILVEWLPGERRGRVITGVITAAGLLAFVFGSYVTLALLVA